MLKEQLANETNKKSALFELLIKYGEEWNKKKQENLEAQNAYMQIKTKIRVCDEKIKTLKTLIRTEEMVGG
jgi:hypothetical protein